MEKTFNKIVLSKTEPNVEDLWMRINIEKLPSGKAIHGHSLWWFTSQGWKKLFDFDTRYSVSTDYSFEASETPYDSESVYDPKVGVVSVSNTYNLYDAARKIGDNANLVTEKGLKHHVDDLQSQINDLKKRMTKAESDIDTLTKNLNEEVSERNDADIEINRTLGTITDTLAGMSNSIRNLESRLNSLES